MNVKIQSVRFDADRKLVDFVNAKMAKLERFAEDAIVGEVIMKVDKDHENGNKVATIKLAAPGEEFVAESRGKTFEEAVDEAIEALKKQLTRKASPRVMGADEAVEVIKKQLARSKVR